MSKRSYSELLFNSSSSSDEEKSSPIREDPDETIVMRNQSIDSDDDFILSQSAKRNRIPDLDYHQKKFIRTLGDQLFHMICSGRDPIFKTKMEQRDVNYIDTLSQLIDMFTDQLSSVIVTDKNEITSCENSKKYCKAGTACRFLPGYYASEKNKEGNPVHKGFIPQMYKILQDYGFFYFYFGIDTISQKLPNCKIIEKIEELSPIDLALRFGASLDKNVVVMDKAILRLNRVIFLRDFNVQCCLETLPDSNHIAFNKVLEDIASAIKRYKAEMSHPPKKGTRQKL